MKERGPDVLCLQETRVAQSSFDFGPLTDEGWHVQTSSTGGYAGVAIISRVAVDEVVVGLPGFVEDRAPGRRLACRIGELWVDTVYVPTTMKIGKSEFMGALRADHETRWKRSAKVILAGDFNLCFDQRDYASPKMITDADVHPNRPEDKAFRALVDGRLYDCFRHLERDRGHFTWFPNTRWALKRNYGMRLDYVFASKTLLERVREATHDRDVALWEKPSDHVPVRVVFE